MVTTVTTYSDPRNRAATGTGYDGVVRVSVAGYYGSGILLYDGLAVLTAAHLFSHDSMAASIQFETTAGTQTLSSRSTSLISSYDPLNENNDLALVWLSSSAPTAANRYDIYRDSNEISQSMTIVGYGTPGSGNTGALTAYSGSLRLKASNQFDAEIGTLKNYLGSAMTWSPLAGSQLVADFDNGTFSQDALGRLANCIDPGEGQSEGLIAPGDSGGPAFIDGQVAGIASYTASLSQGGIHPDIDGETNSSFGEIAAWQRVSHYQQWIDQSLRAQYINAPTQPSEVQKAVSEGNSGTCHAYFLLQFTGIRTDPEQWLSVDYATRDGSAAAGEDYIATTGTLVLYPGENQAVIPVEIIGDNVAEPDETFYLDVTNPVGGSFGTGIVKLTAVRTIVNDDGGTWS